MKAGKPEEAVKLDGVLVDKYPQASEAPAAAWAAGKLYEQAALWDQAARFYQTLADRYPKDTHAADALFNAGLLREHLGDTQAAITAYSQYAQRYKTRDDVRQVAFRVGVVYADAGQHEAAAQARSATTRSSIRARRRPSRRSRARARSSSPPGRTRGASGPLKEAVALFRRGTDKSAAPAAAHARYLEGEVIFREFERLKLASDPKQAQAHARREVEAARAGQGRRTSTW